jgi:external thioesterase TEII
MMEKPQLFLLHFAGGSCYSFQFMLPYLKDFNVLPIELPGRGRRIKESLF